MGDMRPRPSDGVIHSEEDRQLRHQCDDAASPPARFRRSKKVITTATVATTAMPGVSARKVKSLLRRFAAESRRRANHEFTCSSQAPTLCPQRVGDHQSGGHEHGGQDEISGLAPPLPQKGRSVRASTSATVPSRPLPGRRSSSAKAVEPPRESLCCDLRRLLPQDDLGVVRGFVSRNGLKPGIVTNTYTRHPSNTCEALEQPFGDWGWVLGTPVNKTEGGRAAMLSATQEGSMTVIHGVRSATGGDVSAREVGNETLALVGPDGAVGAGVRSTS